MIKKLKTLETIKSEAYKFKESLGGLTMFYNTDDLYFISVSMYFLFGKPINVKLDNNGSYWDYVDEHNWAYIKEWFEPDFSISVLSDEDFVI